MKTRLRQAWSAPRRGRAPGRPQARRGPRPKIPTLDFLELSAGGQAQGRGPSAPLPAAQPIARDVFLCLLRPGPRSGPWPRFAYAGPELAQLGRALDAVRPAWEAGFLVVQAANRPRVFCRTGQQRAWTRGGSGGGACRRASSGRSRWEGVEEAWRSR